MSLATNVTNLATRVATEAKALRTLINGNAADLSGLTTTSKTNLVSAINEVVGAAAAGAGINDTTPSTTTTYSSTKTDAQITAASTTDRARANHTGTQSADTLTDGTTNKAFLATERTKLTGIATAATANQTDVYLLSRTNHTGTQTADTVTDGTTNKAYTATEKTKLAGVAASATANSTDATLLARANHTGTQLAATISDFSAAADARIDLRVAGAPAALDTLDELAAAIGDDANFAGTVTTALGNRVRVDASQTLTAPQQAQARTNIDAAAATGTAGMGDATTDFVATFNAGLV